MLNEKYGISVQNLKDIPTFKSLLNTQVLIFEALANDKADIQDDIKDLRAYLLLVEAHCSEKQTSAERRHINLDPVIERRANPPEEYAD